MPQAKIEYEPFPYETFHRIVGGKNWVIHRRTPRIVAKYGEDVICLSTAKYENAKRLAWLSLTEGLD